MTKFQNKYWIESARLKGYDYSNPWWYYVTINTKNHVKFFGKVINDKIYLNELGKNVEKEWMKSAEIRKNIELDYFVIMPNHIHGIIIINSTEKSVGRDVLPNVSTIGNDVNERKLFFSTISPKPNSLSVIIRGFKATITKWAHEKGYLDFQWQDRFYDRIIRNEMELYQIRKYIEQNLLKWDIEKNEHKNM